MAQSLTQPVDTNVLETFRDDEAVLPGVPRVARKNSGTLTSFTAAFPVV
jgi:hypothetical protein